MNYHQSTREELISTLLKLEAENNSLRRSSKNGFPSGEVSSSFTEAGSQERNAFALEISSDGLWDWNIVDDTIYYSPQYKRLLGFQDSEFTDTIKIWRNRVHPNDLERVLSEAEHHKAGHTDKYICEYRIQQKDGKYLWILDEGRVVSHDKAGNPLRFLGTIKDISTRKEAEYILNERKKKLACYNQITTLVNQPNLGLDEVIRTIVGIIPPCWQFTDHARVSITIHEQVFKTPAFQVTPYSQTQDIRQGGDTIGRIEICYDEQVPLVNPLFLPEEVELLVDLAVSIGGFIDREVNDLELTKRNEKFKYLVENINDIIYEYDSDGILSYISPVVEKTFGFTPGDVIGQNFIRFVGGSEEYTLKVLKELREKKEIQTEYKILSKTGETRWANLFSKANFEGDVFLGATGIVTDITDRKRANVKLQRSELLYRSILNASPDTITITDLEGKILFSSPSTNKMFGYAPTFDFTTHTNLEFIDKQDHEKAANAIQRMFMNEFNGAAEYIGIRADGSQFDIEVNGEFIRDVDGQPVNMIFVTRDISQRKLSEEHLTESKNAYRSLIENINEVIYEIDNQGVVVYISPSIIKLAGFTSVEVIGRSFLDFVGENKEHLTKRLIELSEKIEISNEYKIHTKTGELKWIRVSTKASFVEDIFKGGSGTLIDITEQKLIEQALQKSEETYRNLVERINDVVFEVTTEGIIKYVSPAIEKILGYKAEELTGENFFEYMYPRDKPWVVEALKNLTNQASYLEYRYYQKDGSVRWVRSSTKPLIVDGIIVGGIGVLIDINERKLAEEELRLSETRYKTFFEGNNSIILLVDPLTGTLRDANPAACQYYGWTKQELCGLNIVDINTLNMDEINAEMQLAIQEHRRHFNFKHRLANGQLRDVEVYSGPMEYGAETLLYSIIHDVTERKEAQEDLRISEEKYRNIFESVQDVYYEVSPEGILIDVSPSIEAISKGQYTPLDLIGRYLTDFYADPNTRTTFYTELKRNNRVNDYELFFLNKDGSILPVSISTVLILDSTGNPAKIIGSMRDITERKKAENEIRDKSTLLTNLIVNLKEGILLEDSERKIILTNQLFCDMFAIPAQPELMVGADCTGSAEQSKVLFKNPDQFIVDINRILEAKKDVLNDELQLVDGRYFERDYIPTYLDNTYCGHLWKYRDITERKLAEFELRKLSQVVEQSPVSIVITNLEGDIEYANPKACETTGYSQEELQGRNPRVLKSGETNKIDYVALWRTISSGKVWHGTFHNRTKTGDFYWESASIAPITDENGKATHYVAIKEDITLRKQMEEDLIHSEADLNYAQAIVNMGSWELDFASGHLKWSENNYRLLGLEPFQEEVFVGTYDRAVHPDDLKLLHSKLKEIIEFRISLSFDLRLVMPDGKIKWIENYLVPVIKGDNLVGLKGVNVDITRKKHTEGRLKNQNERLNAIMRAMPDLIFILDKKGTNLEYHTTDPDRLLVAEKDFIGSNLKDLFDKETTELHLKKIDECISLQNMVSFDYSMLSGHDVSYFETRLMPMGTDRVLSFVRDITLRKQNEKQIQKLLLAVTQSPVSVVITNLKGEIEFVNPAFEENTGYSFEMVKGENASILKSGLNDESIYPELWNTINSGGIWQNDWINKKKNGEFYWEHIAISPIHDEKGNILNFLAIKQDITKRKHDEQEIIDLNVNLEKKIMARTSELAATNTTLLNEINERKRIEDALSESEHQYRSVVENIHEVIFQTDVKGLWLFLNQSWENVTGFTVEESLGALFLNYVHPDDRQRNMELFEPLITRQKEYCLHEIRYLTKDGGFRWIEVFARLGLNEKNEITGTYGTLYDITQRRQAEEEIRKARIEAENANIAKSEFLSRMSHELRTPMNSILGFAQLLEMSELNTSQKRGVNHIMHSGKHLLDLINEVLDISRIEAGHMSISLEPIKIQGIIEEMVDVLRPQAIKSQLEMGLLPSADNLLFVKSDKQSLKQILLNLLNNAIKYNIIGGSVLIKAQLIPEKNKGLTFIRISITDTGIGIPGEDIPKLFTPFERIGAVKTQIEGTGLGLAVVKKLVNVMGGFLGVESVLGEGSTFWIELPMAESQIEILQKSDLLTDLDPDLTEKHGTILYIEDNISNIELVEQILTTQRPGIKLISNMYGTQATKLAIEYMPDLILLDLNLPDIHGIEVLRLLLKNEKTKHIPVVVISADAMHKQVDNLMHAGAKKYITKPLEISVFLKTIDEFIQA